MNPPDLNRPASREPERQPGGESAEEFFPNFSTLRAALETAQIGVWSWDIGADKVIWSSNLETIHRLPPGNFDGTRDGWCRAISTDDWPKVQSAIEEALGTLRPYRVRYRLSAADPGDERWLESTGTVAAKNGAPLRMFGLCRDITDLVNLEFELRSRVKQQQALARLGEQALTQPELERLLGDAVTAIAVTLAVDFVKVLELLPGDGDLLLRAGFGWNGDLTGAVIAATRSNSYGRYTLDSPGPVVVGDFGSEKRFEVDAYLREHRCVSGVNVTIASPANRFYGILGVCTKSRREFAAQEVAFLAAAADLLAGAIARRQLEQRHELMIRDMRHRSGNLFSQLLALFSQTARNSRSIADLGNKYRARVLALANAQRLITESGGRSTPLMDLFYVLLGPYLDRVSFSGPNLELEPDPVFNLSAALHELADNAAKHGSLSRSKGRLDLSWSASRTERGMTLVIDWQERNGPATRRPKRLGFGSRLISLVIERQLNGEVTRSFTRKGLSVHLTVPLTHERWPTPPPADQTERT